MRVKAIKDGYYNLKRRKEGVEFDLVPVKGKIHDGLKLVPKTFSVEEQFSPLWMEKVGSKSKAKTLIDEEEVSDIQDPV